MSQLHRPIVKTLHLVPRVLLWSACMVYFVFALASIPDRYAGLLQRIEQPVRALLAWK